MKIPKEIYNYIEFELYRFDLYKEELELERERILESGYNISFGDKIKTSGHQSPTENKAIKLLQTASILGLERMVRAVENALETNEHKLVFKEYYRKKRKDLYLICDDLNITRSTFFRYRKEIIASVAKELGVLRSGLLIKKVG